MAFAVYRPPADYYRGAYDYGGPGHRTVKFKVEWLNQKYEDTSDLLLWRPPIVLVHGLWDSARLWNGFLTNPNLGFPPPTAVQYDIPLKGTAQGTTPSYPPAILARANANQLGFDYNAPFVMDKIKETLENFRKSHHAAATQVDVVAHSMGGVITRWAETLLDFADRKSFRQGNIHKLITIGTPHFGSPFATLLLQDYCASLEMAKRGQIAFGASVVVNLGTPVSGAVYDLQGDAAGLGSGLSPKLQALKTGSGHGVPVAEIAGQMENSTNLHAFYTGPLMEVLAIKCVDTSPLAAQVALRGWPSIFNNQLSDGMVSVTSQLASQTGGVSGQLQGVIHSSGLEKLGFTGPAELDARTGIESRVVDLLNAPSSGPSSPFRPLPN